MDKNKQWKIVLDNDLCPSRKGSLYPSPFMDCGLYNIPTLCNYEKCPLKLAPTVYECDNCGEVIIEKRNDLNGKNEAVL